MNGFPVGEEATGSGENLEENVACHGRRDSTRWSIEHRADCVRAAATTGSAIMQGYNCPSRLPLTEDATGASGVWQRTAQSPRACLQLEGIRTSGLSHTVPCLNLEQPPPSIHGICEAKGPGGGLAEVLMDGMDGRLQKTVAKYEAWGEVSCSRLPEQAQMPGFTHELTLDGVGERGSARFPFVSMTIHLLPLW